jgi:hypothetical protein
MRKLKFLILIFFALASFISCNPAKQNPGSGFQEFKVATNLSGYSDDLGSNCPVYDLLDSYGANLVQNVFIPQAGSIPYYFSNLSRNGSVFFIPVLTTAADCNGAGAVEYGVDAGGAPTGMGELNTHFTGSANVTTACSSYIKNSATWASIAWDTSKSLCTVLFYDSN